jgi:hypothetical protein
MPIPFYNTGPPTPSTKNTINSVTVTYGIRDFLLNSNLGLNGGFYPQLPMSVNGGPLIGQPVLDTSINNNTNVIPIGLPLETWGLFRYDIAILPNQFKNDDSSSPQLTFIEDIPTTQGLFGTVDFPQGIQQYPSSPTTEVSQYGLLGKSEFAQFRETSTLRNLYVDSTKQVDAGDWISLQPAGFSQQITGYLDEYGALNQGGGPSVQSADILGSLLLGQSFDLRASLAGRVLGATGNLDDTKLGQIGAQQLSNALAYNAAFNVQQDILGGLNLQDNILALVRGGPLPGLRPNYKITVPSSGLGRVFDYAASTLGFTVPSSFLSDAASIFLSENQSGNIDRANSMLENTGKGQIESLIANVNANIIGSSDYDNPQTTAFRSGYVPGYKNSKGEIAITPNLYAFVDDVTKGTVLNLIAKTDKLIPEISYNRSGMIKKYGFLAPEETFTGPRGNTGYDNRKISDVGFTWTSGEGGTVNSFIGDDNFDELPIGEGPNLHSKKSILTKTQKLFNSKGMYNIVSAKGQMDKTSSQIESANGFGISKGSAVIRGDRYTEQGIFDGQKANADNTYCRSWTTLDRYDTVSKLIRPPRGLAGTARYPYRHQMKNSVLDEGFVKIAPYKTDSNDTDIKKFMLSIENLAWADSYENLIECERGPGDPLTGKKGRIMWFPPYNIQFNENTSVNWEKTDFIGRGESVYTYNNTERSGTLSFQIIVDHPSYANAFAGSDGPDDNYVASFFAGCVEYSEYFKDRLTPSELQSITIEDAVKPQERVAKESFPPPSFSVYFPNDISSAVYPNYENAITGATPQDVIDYSQNPDGKGFGIGTYKGETTPGTQSFVTGYTDNYNHGFNYSLKNIPFKVADVDVYGASDPNLMSLLQEHISTKCEACVVTVSGYASKQGNPVYNKKLANARAETVIASLKQIFTAMGMTQDEIDKRFIVGESKEVSDSACVKKEDAPTDTIACKKDRKAVVTFAVDNQYLKEEDAGVTPVTPPPIQRTITNNIKKRFYSECSYFEKLTYRDKFVFDSFRQKIRYFHPAFHSTTPEGLNSRLTFLQQCTRQGPTSEEQGANNLAFGRPPVCILRIGDFYNTKIIIDSVAIEYEPLVWDLNPEGVGVQPMIANVSLSFKFIGGSTLMGPINKLQNALSFNYYANTHVYDPRADYISKEKPIIKVKNGPNKEVKDNNFGYYINNTVNDLYYGSAVEFNERNITDVGEVQPTPDQGAANDISSGPTSTQTSTSTTGVTGDIITDITRVKIASATYTIADGRIVLNIQLTEGLTQEYECDATIRSSNAANTIAYNFPYKIKLDPSALFQPFETGAIELGLTELPSDYTTIKLFLNGDQKNGQVNGTIKFE